MTSPAQISGELGSLASGGHLAALWGGTSHPRLELLVHCAGILCLRDAHVARSLAADWESFERHGLRASTLRDRVLVARTLSLACLDDAIGEISPAGAARVATLAARLGRHPDPAVRMPALFARGGLVRALPSLGDALLAELRSPTASVQRRALTSLAAVPAEAGAWAIPPLAAALGPEGTALSRASVAAALPVMDPSGPIAALAWEAVEAGRFGTVTGRWSLAASLRALLSQADDDADSPVGRRLDGLLRDAWAALDDPDVLGQRKAWETSWIAGRSYRGLASPSPDDLWGRAEDLLFDALSGGAELAVRAVQLARSSAELLRATPRTSRLDRVSKTGVGLDALRQTSHEQAMTEAAARVAALRPWEVVLEHLGWSEGAIDELASSTQDALEQGARALLLAPGVHATWQHVGLGVLEAWLDGARPAPGAALHDGGRLDLGPTPGEALTLLALGPLREGRRADGVLDKRLAEVASRVLAPSWVAGDAHEIARFAAWSLFHTGDARMYARIVKRIGHEWPEEKPGDRVRDLEAARRALSAPPTAVSDGAWSRDAALAWEKIVGPAPAFRVLLTGLRAAALRARGAGEALSTEQARAILGDAARVLGLVASQGASLVRDHASARPAPQGPDATPLTAATVLAPEASAASGIEVLATAPTVAAPDDGREPVASSDAPPAAAPVTGAARRMVEATLASFAQRSRSDGVRARWRRHAGPLFAETFTSILDDVERRAVRERVERRHLGPYELLDRISAGGMGELWLARRRDVELGAAGLFAVKLPLAGAAHGGSEAEAEAEAEKLWRAVREEAIALLQLQHPNVVRFVDAGRTGDQPYLVMEYLRGLPLDAYLSLRLLRPWELAPIVRDACAGLAALHAQRIVHRDVKPANLFLCMDIGATDQIAAERCRDPSLHPILRTALVDLGIAVLDKETRHRNAGTPGYLAPEQADGREVDGRADVYALAATVYHAATGRTLYDAAPNPALLHACLAPFEPGQRTADDHLRHALRRLPARIVDLLRRATSLEPAARPTAEAFAREFATAAG